VPVKVFGSRIRSNLKCKVTCVQTNRQRPPNTESLCLLTRSAGHIDGCRLLSTVQRFTLESEPEPHERWVVLAAPHPDSVVPVRSINRIRIPLMSSRCHQQISCNVNVNASLCHGVCSIFPSNSKCGSEVQRFRLDSPRLQRSQLEE
jgi:hypothetical protein